MIKSEFGKTFSGFTNLNWSSKHDYIQGQGKSFIFQLGENTKHNCIQKEKELHGRTNYSSFAFGNRYDFKISDNLNEI